MCPSLGSFYNERNQYPKCKRIIPLRNENENLSNDFQSTVSTIQINGAQEFQQIPPAAKNMIFFLMYKLKLILFLKGLFIFCVKLILNLESEYFT